MPSIPQAISDFDKLIWKGRPTYICFDANVATNTMVQQARLALGEYLAQLEAQVYFVTLPKLKGVNGPDDFLGLAGDKAMLALIEVAEPFTLEDWRGLFHTYEEFVNAPPLTFSIDNFLQSDAATVIAGLSENGKTWIMLSVAKALLSGKGTRLWNYFDVFETAERVVYLIPESTLGPFKHRLELMGMLDYVKEGRLLVRTLSKGPKTSLSDPRLLAAVRGAYVMLDTLRRFGDAGDENSAGEFQELADQIFGLLGAGAHAVQAPVPNR